VVTAGDPVTAVTATSVTTASGRRIDCRAVICATHLLTTLDLLGDQELTAGASARLRTGDGLGMVLRVVTDALPAYDVVGTDLHVGMQLLATSRDQLRAAHAAFLQGRCPEDPPLLVMTPTATDDTLAPPGRHVVSLWTQWHPGTLRDESWDAVRGRETDRLLAGMERHSPGFSSSVVEALLQTPSDLEHELDLRGGNVMHLDMSLDAMFALRPLPEWSAYRGPRGVFLCGASTHPGGGVSGASGRSAARVVARELRGGLLRRRSR
jgi:phytoene dehydrogenase-like protein